MADAGRGRRHCCGVWDRRGRQCRPAGAVTRWLCYIVFPALTTRGSSLASMYVDLSAHEVQHDVAQHTTEVHGTDRHDLLLTRLLGRHKLQQPAACRGSRRWLANRGRRTRRSGSTRSQHCSRTRYAPLLHSCRCACSSLPSVVAPTKVPEYASCQADMQPCARSA